MSRIMSNQKRESCVRTAPFSGIGVGSTTSKAEIRSVAIIRSMVAELIDVAHLAAAQKVRPFRSV